MIDRDNRDCASVDELLVAYGELDAERRGYFDVHLAQCERCRHELEEIESVQRLASQMHLESPSIDRYPEFLRRLSHQPTKLQRIDEASLQEPAPQLEGGGFAAIVPLFGRRLTVRTGFQRGFELCLTRSDGSSLFKVNAGSLTQAAAVVIGTSIVTTGLALGAFMLMLPSNRPPDIVPDHSSVPALTRPSVNREFVAPLVTATAGETTLAVWRHRGAIYAQLVDRGQPRRRYKLSNEAEEWIRNPMLSSNVKVASDGRSYVVVGDVGGALYSWHIDPERREEPAVVLLAQSGTHADLIWTGQHYTAVWLTPSEAPVVEALDIDRNGRPAETTSQILAATEGDNKLSYPKILVQGSRMIMFYRTRQVGIHGAVYERDSGGIWQEKTRLKLSDQSQGTVERIQLSATDHGCRVVWSESISQGVAIRSSILSTDNSFSEPQTVVVSRSHIVDWQSQTTGSGFTLAWLEQTPTGKQLFTQDFTSHLEPETSPQAIKLQMPVALFGFDSRGTILLLVDEGKQQRLVPID